MMNPPMTNIASNANEPKVLATIMFLPSAPMKRNSPEAIWFMSKSSRYCLKNLRRKFTYK